jgi:hypothetical protein
LQLTFAWEIDAVATEGTSIIEARALGPSYVKAADTAITTIADYNHKCMKLSGANTLRSLEYLARLAVVKTGAEGIEVSGTHYRTQLNTLREYSDTLIGLTREIRSVYLASSEREGSE